MADRPCGDDCAAYDKISPALDRFQEAHFWIHKLEEHYHDADLFRWHLNVFLKAIKEVPQLVVMALQNEPGFPAWFKPLRIQLSSDPLMAELSMNRDFVVHRGMLKLGSSGSVGITELRGIKLGIGMPIDPLEDSEVAMDRYVYHAAKDGDFFQFLMDDEDSIPCVERTWKIPSLEGELLDVCTTAWKQTGSLLNEVIGWLQASPIPWTLSCRHNSNRVRFKLFKRTELQEKVRALRAEHGWNPSAN